MAREPQCSRGLQVLGGVGRELLATGELSHLQFVLMGIEASDSPTRLRGARQAQFAICFTSSILILTDTLSLLLLSIDWLSCPVDIGAILEGTIFILVISCGQY